MLKEAPTGHDSKLSLRTGTGNLNSRTKPEMQPRGLGVDLTEHRRAARQEAWKLLAGDHLSPRRSALYLAG